MLSGLVCSSSALKALRFNITSGRKEFGSIDIKVVFFIVAVEGVFMNTSEAYFISVASLQGSRITNVVHFRIASHLGVTV